MAGESLKFPDVSKIFPQAELNKVKPLQVAISGDHPRVLLAEDDPVHSLTLFHFLSQAGYEVVVAVTGPDAITELRKADHPPVAILRAELPGMKGVEICQRMSDAGKNLFLILYSEQPTTEQIVATLEAGADLHLPKSIPAKELLAHVKVGSRIIAREQAMAHRLEELSGKRSKE
ncbi:MAG: response regulator [Chthoniobacter sp.]|uniref:response regulator n=1 Tax=Chthoniobacter sp. TaxID=2510640 RepID=UPI0032A6BE7B